jgi:hypothetical protein
MLTDKQKEALKAVLELHRDNKMTDEQVLTVIEALTENAPTQYIPLTEGGCIPHPSKSWYFTEQEIKPL